MTSTMTTSPTTVTGNALLQAALEYAKRGWAVFPCWPTHGKVCGCGIAACENQGKHPQGRLAPRGVLDATTDEAVIRQWWTQQPDANIGIATGTKSGIAVFDVDPRHGGDVALEELEREHGKFHETPEVLTGGGGRHFYYAHPGVYVKNDARGKLGPGLDFRGDGGYIIAPGSVHASGKGYLWEYSSDPDMVPLAPMPAWMLEKLREAPKAQAPVGTPGGDIIPEGRRNATLTSLAGKLRRPGFTQAALEAALLAENATRCRPPLPDADVRKIAASVSRYAPAAADEEEPETPVMPAPLSAADLLARFPKQREPIIGDSEKGWVRRGEVGGLIAAPKMFKSWLLLFIAVCVALGWDIFGFKTRAGKVLVLDYELSGGTLAKRLQAVLMAMGLRPEDLGDKLVIQPLRGVRLNIDALGRYLAEIPSGEYVLVIVDPMYRIFPPEMDENSNADFAEIFAKLQGYAERLDAAMLIVHHLSKGDQSGKALTDLGSGGGSQARAADAHLAIRPHAVEGAATFGGVVRSFPPFPPFVIRWEWPIWKLDPDLDPADLYRPPPRSSRKQAEATPPPPPKPTWDTTRFAADFLAATPRTRNHVLTLATEAGVPNVNQAGTLLDRGEALGKVFRWKLPKDKRTYFANTPQPTLPVTP